MSPKKKAAPKIAPPPTNDELFNAVNKAVRRYAKDTRVSLEKTLGGLEQIAYDVEQLKSELEDNEDPRDLLHDD